MILRTCFSTSILWVYFRRFSEPLQLAFPVTLYSSAVIVLRLYGVLQQASLKKYLQVNSHLLCVMVEAIPLPPIVSYPIQTPSEFQRRRNILAQGGQVLPDEALDGPQRDEQHIVAFSEFYAIGFQYADQLWRAPSLLIWTINLHADIFCINFWEDCQDRIAGD